MVDRSSTSTEFWASVTDIVTTKVEPVLGLDATAREPVRIYLRDLEAVARAEGGSREALQVIASGRRLLGDSSDITDADRRRLG
ncbi:hypothetical protein [Methylobacterium dankookense]|uniref:Uncharacterized protein n=1 Tax=Methylobacterium dankookense TaxID=560405 RepID=A0A564G769_9HYPH|nr:hypothetical protein [Methylobacterium dankookense]GJD54639.1 hypothetical protein IFDJLNFL_0514 [Methylobacterium dankookense]VUF15690.1 hypothetical protein MTDSW087_05434 [Methylobacterium dankookense]